MLADPEGVELCVIEAGNCFLAGCGPLAKVAWGGEAPEPGRPQRLPERLELDAGPDLAADVERLVGLGAVALDPAPGGVEMLDPDGAVFLLRETGAAG